MYLPNKSNNIKMHRHGQVVKENVFEDGVVPLRWVAVAAVVTSLSLVVAALVDRRLPEPLDRSAPADHFIAEIAHEHLVNLTSIGPRVAGSYENEVLAVQILVEAVKSIAAQASPHNRVDYDVFSASGAFSLTFLDGMSNVYRDVQSVAVRARAAGGRSPRARTALLLNCHFDTVPDSPGASDDGAGCAVALETLRALVAAPRPLRHDVIVLLNGAEENILQASHAFVTQHPWAKSVRAFINIEACGAGGREVLFQAGPHDPWIMEVYAGAVPHPFASSLAQELFESGLIPADTDFRIFRDYGDLSGVDLAWSSNGYVYHTRLDTASRVPPAALQRTGDNVLALTLGLLSNERLELATERERQPVFFDVVGAFVIAARAPAAALAVVVTLATLALSLHLSADDAARQLYMSRRAWWRVVLRAARGVALAQLAGVAAALLPALLLHAAGARLAFYASPGLLVPLYALPALCGAWADARYAWRASAPVRGWWEWRAWRDALALWAGVVLAAGALAGLRSAFLPLLWTLPALAALPRCSPAAGAALHAALSALPALQSAYLALGSVDMFVPIMGRAGTAPLPADVMMSLVVSSLTLTTFSWMLPLVAAARKPAPLIYAGALVSALTVALVLLTPLGAAYSAERPQRVMLFHTRRTLHAPEPVVEDFYWLPELDVNTPHSLDAHVGGMREARASSADECARWLYCGAPYFLPVLSLVSRGHRLPAPGPPLAELRVRAELLPHESPDARTLSLELEGPSHVVVILSPAAGAHVPWCSELEGAPQPGPRWGARLTYFVALHHARRPRPWRLRCTVRRAAGAGRAGGAWLQVSAAGHAMFGAGQRHERHARLLAALPASVAATGWGVDLHLLEL
ncbi:endoplasmic reticulum metallopeptidase 1-like [Vanessa atalanta]|uniref:endoplasmic reticulum metallopeptidase 1-like n=1 Tax=Vanessa atalanta TaxID=42275 RepID=UPI001FCDD4B5|nr:endoplasmic reticulum metallopeptidase 1-like [Vanessa atalanta]